MAHSPEHSQARQVGENGNPIPISARMANISASLNAQSGTQRNRERIHVLSEKLIGLQAGLEGDLRGRIESVEQRIANLNEKVSRAESNDDKKYRIIQAEILKAANDLETERRSREDLTDTKSQELELLEARLRQLLHQENDAMVHDGTYVLSALDEKVGLLYADLDKEAEARVLLTERREQAFASDIPALHDSLRKEMDSREQAENDLIRRLSEEIARLHQHIAAEKKAREETEEAMLKMIEDVFGKLQDELNAERTARAETESVLMRLLEDTCVKLNQAGTL